MYHYPFHVSDYIADTAHLTIEEDIAYRRLLDLYYTTEQAIPLNTQSVSRKIRMPMHEHCVIAVLQEFFTWDEPTATWRHSRCDATITAYQAKAERNREIGKLGGRPKKLLETQTQPTDNPNQEPITNNQEPLFIDADASSGETGFPPCPHKEILALWQKHLPHLTQPRSWEGNRQTFMRQRWKQAARPSAYSPEGYRTGGEGLKWWDAFFGYIANDTTLASGFETNGRTWKPDLEWIINANNFAKIIDGKYAK
jgi:uncharacterized protein YdaU (DUF1376 family)